MCKINEFRIERPWQSYFTLFAPQKLPLLKGKIHAQETGTNRESTPCYSTVSSLWGRKSHSLSSGLRPVQDLSKYRVSCSSGTDALLLSLIAHQVSREAFPGYAEGTFPVTETTSMHISSLPMHPYLEEDDH